MTPPAATSSASTRIIERFDPVTLGKHIKWRRATGSSTPFVTFLVGAGFSHSAGIPLASTIIEELSRENNPLLENIGEPPEGTSKYAWLMQKLGTPKERARRIKQFVDKARPGKDKPLSINWSHLLLAAMVAKGYVHRILTTNFDPLIVEALAIMGQPIRTFDLNTTGNFYPGTLDSASVIYLHGQMHSLFLANSKDELSKISKLYTSVLQEALQDSMCIVVGYSGENDPVLKAFGSLPNLPEGLWWSQYSAREEDIGSDLRDLFTKFGTDCHLTLGDDADMFMRKLVLDGMQLDLPDVVMDTRSTMLRTLSRITPYPRKAEEPASDPVHTAIAQLERIEAPKLESKCIEPNTPEDAELRKKITKALKQKDTLAVEISMAATVGDWEKFDRLRQSVKPSPENIISQSVGTGLLRRAVYLLEHNQAQEALAVLNEIQQWGIETRLCHWRPFLVGNALTDLANRQGNSPEAEHLFSEACEKYSEAVRLKADVHQAFFNWGNALASFAIIKGNSPEAERLFSESFEKYSEAVRFKHDKHEAFNNWGTALTNFAKLKGNTPKAELLLSEACEKYAEAIRIKHDKHEAYNNWGIALASLARLKGNSQEAEHLFSEAFAKYSKTVHIKADFHEAFFNWGIALASLAKLKGDTPEAERFYSEALSKYSDAVRLKPDFHEALFNWGIALADLAKLKGISPEAERLFSESFEKYSKAVRIKPDKHEAFGAWGVSLASLAKLKGDTPEAEHLYSEALAKYSDAVRIKSDFFSAIFNRACTYAIRGDTMMTIAELRRWAQINPLPSRADIQKDSDFDRIRNEEAFKAFLDTLPA